MGCSQALSTKMRTASSRMLGRRGVHRGKIDGLIGGLMGEGIAAEAPGREHEELASLEGWSR